MHTGARADARRESLDLDPVEPDPVEVTGCQRRHVADPLRPVTDVRTVDVAERRVGRRSNVQIAARRKIAGDARLNLDAAGSLKVAAAPALGGHGDGREFGTRVGVGDADHVRLPGAVGQRVGSKRTHVRLRVARACGRRGHHAGVVDNREVKGWCPVDDDIPEALMKRGNGAAPRRSGIDHSPRRRGRASW